MLIAEMPILPVLQEVPPMPNARRQNRETFVRLFQGFVNEYGEVAAKKIIRHLVDHSGGFRICIPGPGPDPLFGCSPLFRQLWRSTCFMFGHDSGRAIMNKIVVELGDRRIWFPDYKDLYLWERNEKIQNLYQKYDTGDNAEELGIRFRCCAVHIRRVVRGEDD